MNAQCPHQWWLTLKSAVLGSSSDSSLSPLIGAGGGLVCESVEKADLLSAHFDGKQSRDPVDLPSTCHPSPSLTTYYGYANDSTLVAVVPSPGERAAV